jgi:hypothetical protein
MILIDNNLRIYEGSQIRKTKPFSKLKKFIYFSVTINILLSVSLYTEVTKPTVVKYQYIRDTIHKSVGDISLTDSAITRELTLNKCVLVSVAVAQAKIESAHYTSPVCKQNNNLFGIKYHKCKYVKGENLDHAVYDSYRDNIKCYSHIQKHYLKNIDGRYASAGGYVELIKQFK